jgi:pyridoxine 4-dehydrogenase
VFSVQRFWLPEVGFEGEIRKGKNLADAAKAAGVQHFVDSSVGGADRNSGIPHIESREFNERRRDLSMVSPTVNEPHHLPATAGGTFTLADDVIVTRMGYGAMQLAGPRVFGPPADRAAAVGVLQEAVALGITHIDTSDYYGPYITNQIIKEALHPYLASLHIVTKVGALRDAEGGWLQALAPEQLRQAVSDNLDHLGLDALDVVNLRVGDLNRPRPRSIAEPFTVLAQLQQEGLIKHLGLSTVNLEQITEAQAIAPIVCVQNLYNLAYRADDALIDSLAAQGIAYVPYFPLGGFSPLQSNKLSAVANRLNVTPTAVALAWLLHRAPNILLIPGTSSLAHLRENITAASLALSEGDLTILNSITSE